MQRSILYFASLREAIGTGEEKVEVPDAVRTVDQLVDWLALRHPGAFTDHARLRCALDQELASFDAPIGTAREIAFFPPVTGG